MAALPPVCAAASWQRHRHGNIVAMTAIPVAEGSSSTVGKSSPTSGLQESKVQSRGNALVAGVAAACVCVSVGLQAGCAVASSDNVPVNGRGWFPWEHQVTPEQEQPKQGTCSTCIGVVDDTLGSCNATTNCVSSFDDRFRVYLETPLHNTRHSAPHCWSNFFLGSGLGQPLRSSLERFDVTVSFLVYGRPQFFVAPWEFPGPGLKAAVSNLQEALLRSGATIKEKSDRYIYVIFTGEDGVSDDVEFLFSDPSVDATVNVRSASRATDYKDNGRNGKRLEALRMELGWEQVPILRNRQRRLFFIESPWDTFGPEPPPTFDYKGGVEFVPD